MKEMPTDDPLFGKGAIRADGRKITRPICSSKEATGFEISVGLLQRRRHHPGRGSFIPLDKSACPMLKKS